MPNSCVIGAFSAATACKSIPGVRRGLLIAPNNIGKPPAIDASGLTQTSLQTLIRENGYSFLYADSAAEVGERTDENTDLGQGFVLKTNESKAPDEFRFIGDVCTIRSFERSLKQGGVFWALFVTVNNWLEGVELDSNPGFIEFQQVRLHSRVMDNEQTLHLVVQDINRSKGNYKAFPMTEIDPTQLTGNVTVIHDPNSLNASTSAISFDVLRKCDLNDFENVEPTSFVITDSTGTPVGTGTWTLSGNTVTFTDTIAAGTYTISYSPLSLTNEINFVGLEVEVV